MTDRLEVRPLRGRYAPSPTGYLHLGNVLAAFLAWLEVRQGGGTFVLRIEDIDRERSREAYVGALCEDMAWLGLDWDEGEGKGGAYGPYTQSARYDRYEAALARLRALGVLYPCFCTRARLQGVGAPHPGEHQVYDGRCYRLSPEERAAEAARRAPSLRVHVPPETISFADATYGQQKADLQREVGDFRVRRADGLYAYALAVVVDDREMGITSVVRGRDLLGETAGQIWLMRVLGGTPPRYRHVPLLVDGEGRRLSKRQKGMTVRELREQGMRPEEILSALAWASGILPERKVLSLAELVGACDLSRLRREDIAVDVLGLGK